MVIKNNQQIKKVDRNESQNSGVIILLRICTVLLAVTSFWATARGMSEYTFPEGWQAYTASLGIQGLLLGLNFSLPFFLKICKNIIQKTILFLLTLVVLFCSSWFSYLYIAGQAYGASWQTYSRLLSQESYRKELFAADTYIERYAEEITSVLAEQVMELYDQASEMDKDTVNVSENLDWVAERSNYTAEGNAARDIMLTVIDAMESATMENAAQDTREQASKILFSMQTTVQSEIDRLDGEISDANRRIENAEASLISAQNRLNNVPNGVDITPYQQAVESASRYYNECIVRQGELGRQRENYQSAISRISYYSVVLGISEEGVSSYFVGANLREIQRELFSSSPDSERMMELATDIFTRIQSSIDLSSGQGSNSEYQQFLTMMNRFVKNLNNYQSIKEVNETLRTHIDDLAEGKILPMDVEFQLNNYSTLNDMEVLEDAERNAWRKIWLEQFNELKSMISGLPVYSLSGININSYLETFDRAASANRLDETIRRYLTDHNPAQQGIIYLTSPYWDVALFSLFLALLLDIAAFVTGVIIDRVSSKEKNHGDTKLNEYYYYDNIEESLELDVDQENLWNSVPTLNRYIFLTGDYMYMNGTIVYKAIENGEETEVESSEKELVADLYLWKDKVLSSINLSLLLFQGVSGGPQDGVYNDSILNYEDELLTITIKDETTFLGRVNPNTPVYQLSNNHYDVLHVKNINNTHGDLIVISLTRDGTRIAAIYVKKSM